MDRSLSGATIPAPSEPASNSNEAVLCYPQCPSITWTSPSDCLVSYAGHSLGWGLTLLQRCIRCILQSQPTGQYWKRIIFKQIWSIDSSQTVNQWVMSTKGYSTLPRSPRLEPYHQMQFSVIPRTPPPIHTVSQSAYSKPHPQSEIQAWVFTVYFQKGLGF